MRALSIRPPWAYYIIYGIPYGIKIDNKDGTSRVEDSDKAILKDVENRQWQTPRGFILPQRIYIHVSKRAVDIDTVMDFTVAKLGIPAMPIILSFSTRLPRGAIIGEIDLIDCIKDSKSPWAIGGLYHFVLRNPKPLEKPIPYKGRLGFFEVDLSGLESEKK